jgi:2-oxo-4-hydroxy-4-carboxy-5-ureidoimidazoline decarboxylase
MESWRRIDSAPSADAAHMLRSCCGAARWVDGMMARRPFGSQDALLAAARDVWSGLSADDWREAFAHHPRIGDRDALARRFPDTHDRSAREQSGVDGASRDVLDALVSANDEYVDRFGYIFIVRAAGRTADQMLAILRQRLQNDPETEIRIAAAEQLQITLRRLCSAAAG